MDFQKINSKIKNNIEIKIISLTLALILWFYVIGQQKAEISFNIPVEVELKENMVAYDDAPEFVTLALRGQQNIIRGLSKSQYRVLVNIKEDSPGSIRYDLNYKNVIGPKNVEIIDISPRTFTAKIGYIDSKNVPVKVVTRGNLPQGYFISEIIIKPEFIKIEGVSSKIKKIRYIETLPVQISGAKLEFTNIIRLRNMDYGIMLKGPNEVKVTMKISREKLISDIRVKVINSQKWGAVISPSIIQAYIYGNHYSIEKLIKRPPEAVIDVKLLSMGEHFIKNIVLSLPDDVRLIKTVPKAIKVVLRDK